ncbi:hypothetical protein [uncultured Roseibium sp.]|uniref:hypothetical protein n=1 Tax=uncultured Roseibium sp. TaxID=1936171 RepID=UPI00262F7815|nr:hypothetical protein [uncultured Roseibium sp.]
MNRFFWAISCPRVVEKERAAPHPAATETFYVSLIVCPQLRRGNGKAQNYGLFIEKSASGWLSNSGKFAVFPRIGNGYRSPASSLFVPQPNSE